MRGRPEPHYFGPEDRPLFGLVHRPDTSATAPANLGVVVCNPFGYEAICAHRSLRHLAEASARAGVPTLRFDYDGAGNSAGSDWDPERLAGWVRSVHQAIDLLKASAGVTRVALVGLRLGATLATLAALSRDDVAGIAAIAPVLSGRAYVRELKALQQALHLSEAPPDAKPREGIQEAVGFVLTAETRSDLSAIDLHKLERGPAASMLLLDRDDFPPNEKWLAHLTGLGVAVEHERPTGYADMMQDPHKSKVPASLIKKTIAWASALGESSRHRGDGAHDAEFRPRTVGRFACPGSNDATPVIEERVVELDGGTPLFAVLTAPIESPHQPTTPRKAVLWLNAGSIPHVGPNRMAVEHARRWAARGYVVLRMDVSGIGESPPRPGEPENVVYTERSREDSAAAVAYLRRLGVSECHAIGLCSGAYNAFKGAAVGQPLDGVVLVNPAVFFWKPGMSLDFEYRDARVNREATRYRKAAFDRRTWMKLARGQVKVRPFVQIMSRRAAAVANTGVRELARRMGRPLSDDLASELQSIAKRGIPMFFVFASGDPGLQLLESEGGATARRLRHKSAIKLAVLEGPDHTFTPLWAQDKLAAILDEHFFGR